MKLTKIHIYGFGQFEDFSMSFQEKFQVIYGINEAGKSTMMAFVKSILFGFPTRTKNKYMPKGSKRYGGTVTITLQDYGNVTIERIDDNKSVTIFCEDGRTEGLPFLNTLLHDIDETHFDGIFSFGLDGLQQLEKIQDDELNDFLLGAGMTGDISVSSIEQQLEKKQQELFRNSGKKPEINQQIALLESLTEKIQAWKEKRNSYDEMHRDQGVLEHRLTEIKQELNEKKQEQHELEKVTSLLPIYEEKMQLHYQLTALPPFEPFPEDGLNRYDQWLSQLVHVRAECSSYEKKMQELEENKKAIQVEKHVLQLEDRMQRVRENESLYQVKVNDRVALQKEIEKIKEDLQLLLQKLGHQWKSDDLETIDTSITAKEELFHLVDQFEEHQQKKQFIEENYFQAKKKRDELVRDEQACVSMLLDEIEQNRLQEQLSLIEEKNFLEKNLKETSAIKENNSWKVSFVSLTLLIFSTILLWQKELMMGSASLLLAIIFVFVSREAYRSKANANEIKKQQKKLQLILNQREHSLSKIEIETKLREHEEATYTLRAQKTLLQEAKEYYEKMTEEYVDWQYEEEMFRSNLTNMLKHFKFDEKLSTKGIREAFTLVEEGKKMLLTQQRKIADLLQVENDLAFWDNEVRELCESCKIESEQNWSRLIEKLYRLVMTEKEKLGHQKKLEAEQEEVSVKLAQWQEKSASLELQMKQLFHQANVTSEEAFIKKAKANQQANELKQKITILDAQLATQISDEEKEQLIEKLNRGSKETNDQLQQLEKELSNLVLEEESVREKLTNIIVLKKQLEEDGSYSDLLQQYEMEKSKLNNLAEEWAVLAIAASTLEKTKNRFREERLPKVMKEATQYFTIFTKHRYDKILAPLEKNSFTVQRNDGRRFLPNELSRGTQEQLYLAIRLALANVYPSASKYPLIVDDIFVNFDHARTKRAVEVFRIASQEHQVIFFTCHHHLLTHFTEDEVITLSVKANGIQEEGYEVS